MQTLCLIEILALMRGETPNLIIFLHLIYMGRGYCTACIDVCALLVSAVQIDREASV